METNAKSQLNKLVNVYSSILPTYTFPWIMLTLAAIAQFFAWFGGRYLFPKAGLCKRIFLLWCVALLQFVILIPTIGVSTEILGHSESFIVILFITFQLLIFIILNKFTLKSSFTKNHLISFILIMFAVILSRTNYIK